MPFLCVRSITWFDDVTQRLYLWPQTHMAVMDETPFLPWSQAPNASVACFGVVPSPLDGNVTASNWLYSRSAASIAANATVPWWTATPDGTDVRVQRMVGTPLGSFYAASSVWLPDRRQLLAFGSLRVYNRTALGVPLCSGPQGLGKPAGLVADEQCLDIANDTYIYDLATNTWTALPVETAGLPFDAGLVWNLSPNCTQPAASPNPLGLALSPVYVPDRESVVTVSGGFTEAWCLTSQTAYEFQLNTLRWVRLTTTNDLDGPLPRLGYSNTLGIIAYSPTTREIVSSSGTLFGGVGNGLYCFVLSLDTLAWRHEAACDYTRGPWFRYDAAAWSDGEGSTLVVGGRFDQVAPSAETHLSSDVAWQLSAADLSWTPWAWEEDTTPTPDFFVAAPKVAHDPQRRRSFLWGGVRSSKLTISTLYDCSYYKSWAQCQSSPGPFVFPPFPGSSTPLYYDPTTVHIVNWPPPLSAPCAIPAAVAAAVAGLGASVVILQGVLLWQAVSAAARSAWLAIQRRRLLRHIVRGGHNDAEAAVALLNRLHTRHDTASVIQPPRQDSHLSALVTAGSGSDAGSLAHDGIELPTFPQPVQGHGSHESAGAGAVSSEAMGRSAPASSRLSSLRRAAEPAPLRPSGSRVLMHPQPGGEFTVVPGNPAAQAHPARLLRAVEPRPPLPMVAWGAAPSHGDIVASATAGDRATGSLAMPQPRVGPLGFQSDSATSELGPPEPPIVPPLPARVPARLAITAPLPWPHRAAVAVCTPVGPLVANAVSAAAPVLLLWSCTGSPARTAQGDPLLLNGAAVATVALATGWAARMAWKCRPWPLLQGVAVASHVMGVAGVLTSLSAPVLALSAGTAIGHAAAVGLLLCGVGELMCLAAEPCWRARGCCRKSAAAGVGSASSDDGSADVVENSAPLPDAGHRLRGYEAEGDGW